MIQALKTSLMITSNVSKANVASSLPDKFASGPNNYSNVPLAVTVKEAGNGKSSKIEKKVTSNKKPPKSKTSNSVPNDLLSFKSSLDSSTHVNEEAHEDKTSLNQKDPSKNILQREPQFCQSHSCWMLLFKCVRHIKGPDRRLVFVPPTLCELCL